LVKTLKFVSGPFICFLFVFFIDLESGSPAINNMAGVAAWMALWWILEVVPLAVTAMLPIVLFPVLGIMDGKLVAPIYFNHIIFLFIGGFLVALAMQKWDLHKRLALRILLLFGSSPQKIMLGFMVATAFLSMWISNTATTMMMVPIAFSIILKLEDTIGSEPIKKYVVGILLGIAFSASIGGIATLVGTPPNLSFARILMILFPEAPEISFFTWMLYALPISLVFLFILWVLLRFLFPIPEEVKLDKAQLKDQHTDLGSITYEEKIVLVHFITLVVLWIFRADIDLGIISIPGWSNIFGNPAYLNDGTVAIFVALSLFVFPAKSGKNQHILDWETASRLPWHIVLLFGGGFALAMGFKETGLAIWLGTHFIGIGSLPLVLIVLFICLFVTFLTELTSNTATAEMFLPILGGLAMAIEINPLVLMIPATLSCSFAFMLPVATPPNAIVFSTGRLSVHDMARIGIWLNLIGAILITISIFLIGRYVFHIDLSSIPIWG
jgi:sodium-dependent dicarboxylate transporter 2/3/5